MKYILSAIAAAFAMTAAANATMVMVGGTTFDTDNAATDVLWAQGGIFSGNTANLRSSCVDDPIQRTSSVGQPNPGTFPTPNQSTTCRADEVAGFDAVGDDLTDSIELDENNIALPPTDPNFGPDVLAAFFDNPLVNGAGVDVIIFETLNQNDAPSITLMLNGMQLAGSFLGEVTVTDGLGNMVTLRATGFDFDGLGFAMGAMVAEPIFIQTNRDAQNTPVGSSDIVAIVGVNQMGPPPVVPLPAAAPLFFAGLAGLGFAGRRRKKIA